MYKPYRPPRVLNGKEELGFCSATCRKSYHKHGGAYRKLKAEMEKMVTREFAKMREAVCRSLAELATRVDELERHRYNPTN